MNWTQSHALLEHLRAEHIEKARRGLLSFTIYTKPDYETNWHHIALCKILNRFVRGEITRLMVFLPPRHGKSELVSRRLPAFIHGLNPNAEIMLATYGGSLASDMTVDIQRIIDLPAYQELFPSTRITPEGSRSAWARNSTEYEIMPYKGEVFRGAFRAQGMGGSFTGRGASHIIIDDPLKNRDEADSKVIRDAIWKFYTSTLYTRLEKNGQILLTMTRWHDDDLAGRLIKQAQNDPQSDQWEIFTFPALREADDNPLDQRAIMEPLWPTKYSLERMLSMKQTVGSRDWAALFQQRPQIDGGNLIKREWWKYWRALPARFDQVIQSWDFAVKDTSGADYTVGQVWGRVGSEKYLLDQVRGQMSFPSACQAVVSLSSKWPAAHKKLIEDKANGPAVIDTLKKKISGLVPIQVHQDKVARANAIAPDIEAGNIFIPDPSIAPWTHDFVEEWSDFPRGVHDDQVDATSQAISELRKMGPQYVPMSGHGAGFVF